MAYNGYEEISFANGYYHIGRDGFGIVSFDENTPKEIIQRFWEVWPSFREKVITRQKTGVIDSKYPVLPWNDPEENKKHYENRD